MTGTGDSDNRYRYTSNNAMIYDTFEIAGTTYEIGFRRVAELLGDITGRVFLDFGTGTGRSAAFLKALGAEDVYAVDHDRDMIQVSRTKGLGDAGIRTRSAMRGVCSDVARTLRRGSPFIVMSSSPMSFGHTFRSYHLQSGTP